MTPACHLSQVSRLMRARVVQALAIATLLAEGRVALAQRPVSRPDLQGTWNGSTLTPLQRPQQIRDRSAFTLEEAAEYVRSSADRIRSRLPTAADRQMQIDIDDTFVEVEQMPLDGLRTSLIVDPANGMLPPLVPAARARIANRPKRSFDDPETFGLAERCLLGNFGASGGSLASPPMVPSQAIPSFYQIVQTDTHVLIFTEWVHDARIIRLNGTAKLARRFSRTLRRSDAGRRYDELPPRDAQPRFRRRPACRRALHAGR